MKKFVKKYVGDKAFYKMIFIVALPMVLQNVVSNFVNLLDNVMVGQLGQDQVCGVAFVNQIHSIYTMSMTGIVTGVSIFTSQLHGQRDKEGVAQTFRIKLIATSLMTVATMVICTLFGEDLIKLFISDKSVEGNPEFTLKYGMEYLRILIIGMPFLPISMSYASTMRETENTAIPMIAGCTAIGVNAIGNFLLIFGNFGFPKLDVSGAAIATVLSRVFELAILVVATHVAKKSAYSELLYKHFFSIDAKLVKNILKKGTPLFINNFLWSFGMSAVVSCYSGTGLSAGAAYSSASAIISIFSVFYVSLGYVVGVFVGKYLGAGAYDTAEDISTKMIAFCVALGTLLGIMLASTSGLFPKLYNISDEARGIASSFLLITGCLMPLYAYLQAANATVRAGGSTFLLMLFDGVFVCCIVFPLAYVLSNFTSLRIELIYLIVNGVEVLSKDIFGFVMLKKKKWIHKIV